MFRRVRQVAALESKLMSTIARLFAWVPERFKNGTARIEKRAPSSKGVRSEEGYVSPPQPTRRSGERNQLSQ